SPRMANSRPQPAVVTKRRLKSGPDRLVNGVSSPITIPVNRRPGARPKALSGLTKDSTFRDGFSHLRASSPVKNIQWSFSFMADLPAQQCQSGRPHLEWHEPLSRRSRHAVTTFCCQIPAEAMAREKSLLARM